MSQPDDQPAVDAKVRVLGPARLKRAVRTDDDGRFSLGGLVPGHYTVVVAADGFSTLKSKVEVQDGATKVDLMLQAACAPKVRVVPSEPDRPMTVRATTLDQQRSASVAGHTMEPVTLKGLSGRATLEVAVEGSVVQTASATVDLCGAAEHVVTLAQAPHTAQVTVVTVDLEGRRLSNIDVWMSRDDPFAWRAGKTNETGRVRFVHLPPGEYLVGIRSGDWVVIDLPPGETLDVELSLDRKRGDVVGTVTDAAGAAVNGARIVADCGDSIGLRNLTSRSNVVARSDGQGEFRFDAMDGGICHVRAEHASLGQSETIMLKAGGPGGRLVLRAAGVLAGRVVGPDGRPVHPYSLRVGRVESWGAREVFVNDASGAFYVENVSPGPVALHVTAGANRGYLELDLRPGEQRTGLVVALFAKGRVIGVVTDEADRPLPGAQVKVLAGGRRPAAGETGPDGRFELQATAGAPVTVLAVAEGHYPQGTVPMTLSPAGVTDIGTVRLQIREPDRKAGAIGVTVNPELQGVRIIAFLDESPARDAGLELGDVIVSVDGVSLARLSAFSSL